VAAFIAAVAVACLQACTSQPSSKPSYEGELGELVAIELYSDVPAAHARAEPHEQDPPAQPIEGAFIVDTGSPVTVIDGETGVPDSLLTSTLSTFGVVFTDTFLLRIDLFAPELGLFGIIGGDILRYFCLALDYRSQTGALHERCPLLFDSTHTQKPPIELPFRLLGGGALQLEGGHALSVPATRIALRALVEGHETWAVVDTGASAVVLSGSIGRQLMVEHPQRPLLEGMEIHTASGSADATLLRASTIEVGSVLVESVPCFLPEDTTLFDYLSQEVGRDVTMLIGGTFLREFSFIVDYPAGRLRLARYVDRSHIDPGEFVFVGLALADEQGRPVVAAVYPDTDAATKDIQAGDEVKRIDGVDVQDVSDAIDLISSHQVGEMVAFTLSRDGHQREVIVQMEDLLPDFYE
jgi:hypothetical protein